MAQSSRSSRRTPLVTTRSVARTDFPVVESLFGKNGACGGCWCMYWRVEKGGKSWDAMLGEPAKRGLRGLIESGEVHAVLAFVDGEPAGWCLFGRRAEFPRLARVRALAHAFDEKTWSVVCFFVRSGHRGAGIATALLAHAKEAAGRAGAQRLEGYPVRSSKGPGAPIPAAFAWTGVPEVFERNGFKRVSAPDAVRDVYAFDFGPSKKTARTAARTRRPRA